MLIRGISPVMDENIYIGSIEAITNFDSLIKKRYKVIYFNG